MKPKRPLVFHSSKSAKDAVGFPPTGEHHFVDDQGRWAGWAARITNERGHVSGWHHHPESDTYVLVISGTLTISYGDNGAENIEARPGDLVLIPSGVVHRETTSPESDLDAFVFRIGGPPETIDVDSP